jgi:hypothetical protein
MAEVADFDPSPLLKGAEALGIKTFAFDSIARKKAVAYYPMFYEDDHMSMSGVELFALFTSDRLRKVLPSR